MPRPTERLFRLLVAHALEISDWRSLVEQVTHPWRWAGSRLEIHLFPEKGHFEYRWATPPKKLPGEMKRLFWDIEPGRLDLRRNGDYVIKRVLEKGDLEDWNWLRWTYGEARIAAALNQSKTLQPATVNLWKNILLARFGTH